MATKRKPLTDIEWLKKWSGKLEITKSPHKDTIQHIMKIKSKDYNESGAWSLLKLILLNYILDVCTIIIYHRMKTTPQFEKMYYVDLFAGSGINKLKHKKDFFIGSPLIASLNYSDKYTTMFFCEDNPNFANALKMRLNFLKKKNLIVTKNDCNVYLNKILKEVDEQKSYSLFFIDPYAMEFPWESMKKVLAIKSDIIFTLMSWSIMRDVASAKKIKGRKHEKLTKFFGDDSWKSAKDKDGLAEIYKQNMLKERIDAPITIIKIKSERFHFHYHMFFISNKTRGGNPWFKAIDTAKKRIEKHSDKVVEMALEIIKAKQTELSQF